MKFQDQTGSILTVDLNVLAKNFSYLKKCIAKNAVCSAVVKSNAYGLGLEKVVSRLLTEGCHSFFVAMMDEAIELRGYLKQQNKDADIYLLNGLPKGIEKDLTEYKITPVLNSIPEIEFWAAYGKRNLNEFKAIINIDTGMSRLGLDTREMDYLLKKPELTDHIDMTYLMSHLACADDKENRKNEQQRRLFEEYRLKLLPKKSSLANSAGIFLGKEYHYDLVRPGAAIYGLQPIINEINKVHQVINLKGRIIKTLTVDQGKSVGYGATYKVTRQSRLATVALGYGDGYFRTLGNRGHGYIGNNKVPIVGRISMDLVTFDVTDISEKDSGTGAMIEIIGPRYTVDNLAADAGTIGYEILTSLGERYFRKYVG